MKNRSQELPCRIAILSSLPPPFGGVTVHVQRLTAIMRQKGIAHKVYEQTGKCIPEDNVTPVSRSVLGTLKFWLGVPEPIVHLHTNSLPAILLTLFLLSLRRKKVIVTFHSEKAMRVYGTLNPVLRLLTRSLMRRAAHVVGVSERIATWVRDLGVAEHRITVCPAFLPPSEGQLRDELIPVEAQNFLAAHSQVIGTQGWFGYFVDGKHVYAFELLCEMLATLRKQWPGAGMFTVISGTYEQSHKEAVLRVRHEMGLDDHWLILEEPFHAVALYKKCDLFVRPTITDGDAVSIRECLWLGVPVVASDAVDRPQECVLFDTSDLKSMTDHVLAILDDLKLAQARVEACAYVDTESPVIEAYVKLLTELDVTAAKRMKVEKP